MIARLLRYRWAQAAVVLVVGTAVWWGLEGLRMRHDVAVCLEIGGEIRHLWIVGEGVRPVCVDPVYWP